MVRPKNTRKVLDNPGVNIFKPAGVRISGQETIILTIDEYEAVRLADFEGLYQESAAEKMEISRQTFGRILDTAHFKISDALVNGKILKIEGGEIIMSDKRVFKCYSCEHTWELDYGGGRPSACPKCGSQNFHRIDEDAGRGRGRGGGGAGMGRNRGGGGAGGGGGGGGRGRGLRCGVQIEEKRSEKEDA
jgi:predicted DNA-binding protein (UPF0251 family)